MSVFKRGDVWWYEFLYGGRRIRESAKTHSKTVAKLAEQNRRRELEQSFNGITLEERRDRIATVRDVIEHYEAGYAVTHRPSSVAYCRKRLACVRQGLGGLLITQLTEARMLEYIRHRKASGAAGRTINMELGELSRAIGRPWSVLWPKVRKQEERSDVGRAITAEEERRLLEAADQSVRPMLGTFLRVALATGMRSGEITSLTWGQVDIGKGLLQVGQAKTKAGSGRIVPMNETVWAVMRQHEAWFVAKFGSVRADWYLFPFGSPVPHDPTRRVTDFSNAWDRARERSGVECRIHDLRHTAISRMLESGVPESVVMAIAGHVSRRMLERYSHTSLIAKRRAVEALVSPTPQFSETVPTKVPTVETIQ